MCATSNLKKFRPPCEETPQGTVDFSLSMGGIVSKLSGRKRSDYSEIKKVIMALCDIFPAMFRFVICDGIGGYNDDAGSVCYTGKKSDDGSRTRGWREHTWKDCDCACSTSCVVLSP
jgi:hypothetical protein